MDCRGGIYSAGIGAMAVALLALMVFSAHGILLEEESEDYLAVMGDVRTVWTNTVLVFDSAVEDAADDTGCVVGQADIEAYLNNAISSINSPLAPGVQCSYSTESFSVAGNTVTYEANISCEREIARGGRTDFKASYSKNVIFVKTCS